MTKTGLAETREELLLSLINRETPRATKGGGERCVYNHNINGGCAIGCQIFQSLALKLDSLINPSVSCSQAFDMLPKRLQNMGQKFLQSVQSIHDLSNNWTDGKLNNKAKEDINRVIDMYRLDLQPLEIE